MISKRIQHILFIKEDSLAEVQKSIEGAGEGMHPLALGYCFIR
jgi:hypothetical protein